MAADSGSSKAESERETDASRDDTPLDDASQTDKSCRDGSDDTKSNGTMGSAASRGTPVVGTPLPLSSRDVLIGTILQEKFEITERLGAGGMSVVYKATDLVLNRPVAIKVLRQHLTCAMEDLLRFQQEALVIGRLEHPNIVRIHALEFPLGESPFMVMDYIAGESLAAVISREGALPISRCLTIILQVCQATGHAHERGVIHRDLKPGNVLLLKDGNGQDLVKIVDFGIAKLQSGSAQGLTKTGEIFGSPLYMSPEQCMGQDLDARSDVYSVGCVFYEMLTGKPPFDGITPLQTLHMQLNERPKPIGKLKNYGHVPEIESVVLKAMAKDPARRYQSMAEVCQALSPLLQEQSPTIISRARSFWDVFTRQHKARSARTSSEINAAVIICLGAICVAASAYHFFDRLNCERDVEIWPKLDKDGQEFFDSGAYDQAESTFKRALSSAMRTPSANLRASRLVISLDELIDLYHVTGQPQKADQYRQELGGLTDSKQIDPELVQKLKAMKDHIAQLESVKGQLSKATDPEENKWLQSSLLSQYSLVVNDAQAVLLDSADSPNGSVPNNKIVKQAQQTLERCASEVEDRFGRDQPVLGKALHHLATSYFMSGNIVQAAKYYDKADAFLAVNKNLPTIDRINYLAASGEFYLRCGESGKAIPILEKALEVSGGTDAESRTAVTILFQLSNAYYRHGDMRRSILYAGKALSTVEVLPDRLKLWERSLLLSLYGNIAQSSKLGRVTLIEVETSDTRDFPGLCLRLETLARAYQASPATMPLAEPLLRRSIAIRERLGEDAFLFSAYVQLANLYCNMHKVALQIDIYAKALPLAKKTFLPNSESLGCVLNDFAYAQMTQGDFKSAESNFKQAVEIFEKNPNAPEKYRVGAFKNLADLFTATGRYKEAREMRKRIKESSSDKEGT